MRDMKDSSAPRVYNWWYWLYNRHPKELPATKGWTQHPDARFFQICDRCGRRRLFGEYYEAYPASNSYFGWWYECIPCHIDSIHEYIDAGN